MFYSDFWLKHHPNLGFQPLLDQFCEGQACNSFEGILQNQNTKNNHTQKTMFETKWWYYRSLCFFFGFASILSQTFSFKCFFFFEFCFNYVFVFFLVFDF